MRTVATMITGRGSLINVHSPRILVYQETKTRGNRPKKFPFHPVLTLQVERDAPSAGLSPYHLNAGTMEGLSMNSQVCKITWKREQVGEVQKETWKWENWDGL